MTQKCKSCPYFSTSEQLLEKLKELEFWLHATAIQKTPEPVNAPIDPEIVKEIKKIEAVLRLIYRGKLTGNIETSEEGLKKLDALNNQSSTKGDKQ